MSAAMWRPVSPVPFAYAYTRAAIDAAVDDFPILKGMQVRVNGDVDDPFYSLICIVRVTTAQDVPKGPSMAAARIKVTWHVAGQDGDQSNEASDALMMALDKAWRSGLETSEGWATRIDWTQMVTPRPNLGTTADTSEYVVLGTITARRRMNGFPK